MTYQSREDATAPDESCKSEDITKKAAMMMELKERIHERAMDNIHKAQEKYKHYYDEKHSDPKVINSCFL